MRNLNDVFETWGTLTEMAGDLGENRWTVEKWKERRRIPSTAWLPLIRALNRKGYVVTSDDLLTMHERARQTSRV